MGVLIAAWGVGVGAWWLHISRQHVRSLRKYRQSRGSKLSRQSAIGIYLSHLPMAILHGFLFWLVPILWIASQIAVAMEGKEKVYGKWGFSKKAYSCIDPQTGKTTFCTWMTQAEAKSLNEYHQLKNVPYRYEEQRPC